MRRGANGKQLSIRYSISPTQMCIGNIQRLTKLYNYVKIGGEKNFKVPEYYILELSGKNKIKEKEAYPCLKSI